MRAEQNERLTRVGPGTPAGELLRRYWQPAALVAEFDPALDPRTAGRPVKALRMFGLDLVLFRDASGHWGLLDRDCPHRGADLAFGRHEGDGLRCPYHGWKFSVSGACLETPAEPQASRLCDGIRQRCYPVREQAGVLFAWLGPEALEPPPLPALDCFAAPPTHSFAFKGLWQANWLQAFEVGIDPAHTSFLHRYLQDESLDTVGSNAAGRQFRSASAGEVSGERWPMTRIMREFHRPDILVEPRAYGMQITTLRAMSAQHTHVRVTQSIFPATFVIPLSETLTITQMHVPVDDERTYWYSFFTSYGAPLDHEAMRAQRLRFISPPDYVPKAGRHNGWGFDPAEQASRTYLGMGEEDINVHDQWAVESGGAIRDRTREHLGTSDRAIIAYRRALDQAIAQVSAGGVAPGIAQSEVAALRRGPDTVDGIAPAEGWEAWWPAQVRARRDRAPWAAAGPSPADLPTVNPLSADPATADASAADPLARAPVAGRAH